MALKKVLLRIKKFFSLRSVKKSWLLSYIAVIVVMLLLILCAENIFFNVVVEDTVRLKNEELSTFSSKMDSLTEECKLFAVNLTANERFMLSFTKVPKTSAEHYALKEIAAELRREMKSVEKFFVYIKNENMIVSYLGHICTPRHYYDIYYSDSALSYEEWMNEFLTRKYSGYHVFENKSAEGVGRLARFCYIFPMKQLYNEDITIFAEIESTSYESELAKLDDGSDVSVLIYDDSEKRYFSKGKNIPDSSQLKKGEKERAFYDTFIDSRRVVMRVMSSDFAEWKYAFAIPYSTFWARLIQVRYIGIAIFILIAVMGFLGIYLITKYNYKAVANIIKKIESNFSGSSVSEENEYARINKMIDVASQYSRKMENQHKQERVNLILKLMLGVAPKESEQEEIKTLFTTNTFITAAFCAPDYEEKLFPGENISRTEKSEAIKLIITNIFTELMEPYGSIDTVELNNMTFLFSPLEKYVENATCIICDETANMRKIISEHFGVDILCGISSPVKSIDDISISYREALSALDSVEKNSKTGISIYSKKSVLAKSYYYPIDQMQYLMMLLSRGEKEDALHQIGIIFEINSAVFEVENLAKALITDIAATIMKAALNIGYKIDAEKLMDCAKTAGRRAIDSVFESYISDICEFASGGSVSKETTMIDKINEIIAENYTNTEFNVNMIADILNVNANSLSVIYKRKTDGNILEYIQSLRVKEAKRLLEESDISLDDVSQQAGFGSNTTFRRVFKKCTGISPGIYREMNKKE